MFNPKRPYNDLPFLPPKKVNFESSKIQKKLINAKKYLTQLDSLIKYKLTNKSIFLEHFAIRESVESSQIENINTTVETTYKAEYEIKMSPEQKETLYYKQALLKGYSILKEKGFINRNGISEIGKTINPTKGMIRNVGNAIEKKGYFGSEVIYTPPIGQNSEGRDAISDLLTNYENFFNSSDSEIDPLIRTALIHYQFEAIHPFLDGNGRTGRLLMLLHLVLHGELNYPILFLSGYINRNKSEYYELLMEVTRKGKREDFILFILHAIEEQSKNTISMIEKVLGYQKDLSKKLDFVMKEMDGDYKEKLYNIFSSKVYVSLEEIIKITGVSTNTGTKLNKLLVSEGVGVEKRIGLKKVVFNKNLLKIFEK